jgi:nicotinamide-nucleotide amidase
MWPVAILALAEAVLAEARAKKLKIVTAESCTGGLVASALTDSNEAKHQTLSVSSKILQNHGAVSEQAARAMAEGALKHAQADIAVAITGVAGPGGATPAKPVGLVHFAVARKGGGIIAAEHRFGEIGRHEVRMESVEIALNLLQRVIHAPN